MSKYPQSPDACMIQFRRAAETESVLSPRTISFYYETQHAVLAILENGKKETHPCRISEEEIRWLLYEEFPHRNFTFHTQRGYIFALHQLMKFCGNNIIDNMKLKWPKNNRPNADWLTFEEAEQLLSYKGDPHQKLAIHLMLCLGLRRGECITLCKDWIHGNYIQVLGKGPGGGKWRPVPFHKNTPQLLTDYYAYRSNEIAKAKKKRPASTIDPPELFITCQSGGRIGSFASSGYGWDRRTIFPIRDEIGFHFSNHTLRRTFGRTMYYVGKTDIVTLARIMGHESTSETLKYIGVDLDEMSSAMANSPF